ncbi:hypothetical protein BCR44DRAFT_1313904 [Catenaria anguillulae PL171]|uniref:C2H2-type domain-containing protein n=1 Tax=Catenaria anguillulae PL171 TaxID=765915 RepID=A0A1Y2H757_9FUNG|nr:hypothetical protein BCR44DRAFT_1313904 [Catenaria anguillulae PL171]
MAWAMCSRWQAKSPNVGLVGHGFERDGNATPRLGTSEAHHHHQLIRIHSCPIDMASDLDTNHNKTRQDTRHPLTLTGIIHTHTRRMLSSSAISVSAANDLDRILLGSSSTSSISISTARPPRPLPPVPSHQQPLQGPASVAAAAAPAATSTMTDNSNGNTPDDDNGPFACKWRGCSLVFDDPEDLFAHCTNDHVGRKSPGRCA